MFEIIAKEKDKCVYTFSISEMKGRVEALIEKDYLKRDKGDISVFHYVP